MHARLKVFDDDGLLISEDFIDDSNFIKTFDWATRLGGYRYLKAYELKFDIEDLKPGEPVPFIENPLTNRLETQKETETAA